MKLIKKFGDWILIALLCACIVSIALLWPAKGQNFAMPWLAIHIGIVVTVFAAVLVGGALLERKIVKHLQSGLKKEKKVGK